MPPDNHRTLSEEYDEALDRTLAAQDRSAYLYVGFAYLIRGVYAAHNPGVLSDETVCSIMHDLILAAKKKSR